MNTAANSGVGRQLWPESLWCWLGVSAAAAAACSMRGGGRKSEQVGKAAAPPPPRAPSKTTQDSDGGQKVEEELQGSNAGTAAAFPGEDCAAASKAQPGKPSPRTGPQRRVSAAPRAPGQDRRPPRRQLQPRGEQVRLPPPPAGMPATRRALGSSPVQARGVQPVSEGGSGKTERLPRERVLLQGRPSDAPPALPSSARALAGVGCPTPTGQWQESPRGPHGRTWLGEETFGQRHTHARGWWRKLCSGMDCAAIRKSKAGKGGLTLQLPPPPPRKAPAKSVVEAV